MYLRISILGKSQAKSDIFLEFTLELRKIAQFPFCGIYECHCTHCIGLLQIELPKFNSDCNLVNDSSASIPFPPGCDRNGHNFKIILFLRTKLTQYINGLK